MRRQDEGELFSRESKLYFRCRSCARQQDEGVSGGTRRVSQAQELVGQHDEGVSGGNEKGIPGAEAGAPAG